MDAGEQFVIMAGAAMMPELSASMYIHLSWVMQYVYIYSCDCVVKNDQSYTSYSHHNLVLPVPNPVFCIQYVELHKLCAVSSATHVFGEGTGPVWLTYLRCSYYDTSLDHCGAYPQSYSPCQHYEDAAVICQGGLLFP